MCTDYIQSYKDLQQELENAKDTLVVLNDNINRIIGRNSKLTRDTRSTETKRTDSEKVAKKYQQLSSCLKKNTKSVFKRLSSPTSVHNNSESRPRLTSRVIRELPSRQEIVAAQCADSQSRARNRRMFGSLLGTLHKFCQEESRLKQKEEKKAQIEKKLEEQETLQRESLKKERETLFIDRKRKQMQIKQLELKMSRIKDFETWEHSMRNVKHFIKTKTSPSLYFRPKVLTNRTEKLLAGSLLDIEESINKKKEELKINLLQLEENFHLLEHETKISDSLEHSAVITNNAIASSICITNGTKCSSMYPDSKENNIRNFGEPLLSSSIVVIKQ